MAYTDVQRLVLEVERLGTLALPYADLHREITDRVRRVMPIDAACWHGLDPDTVLMTTADPVELFANGFLTPESEMVAAGSVLASEYQRHDVNTFASLAGRRGAGRRGARPFGAVLGRSGQIWATRLLDTPFLPDSRPGGT